MAKKVKTSKKEKRKQRHARITAKAFGVAQKPRLCVFRSLKHIYAQLIEDENGKTLIACSDQEIKKTAKEKTAKTGVNVEMARNVGKLIAEKAKKEKIEAVIFDRGGYRYHGKVKALAEGAREGGLKF
ncbi:MAG: 50S ribosomal protein L18 [bacterium]